MKFVIRIFYVLLATGTIACADALKVDLNPPENRKDILTPHWENWTWHGAKSSSQVFGQVTVTFRPLPPAGEIAPILFKGLLDDGATMAADGIVSKNDGGIEMIISGLSPGEHTVVTYHNEIRDVAPAKFDVFVGGELRIKGLSPSLCATNDYQVASAFVEVEAKAGKDVVIRFQPESSSPNHGLVINGFEIDTVNPRLKAIEPSPANDDEHWPNESPLTWVPATGAVAHQLYLGTNFNAVASASTASPEFKGNLTSPVFTLPKLDFMQDYYWRVDEVDAEFGVFASARWRFLQRKATDVLPPAAAVEE
jgi:hypothetical protein